MTSPERPSGHKQKWDPKPLKNKLTVGPGSSRSMWPAGMRGCRPATAGDQVAVDLWNARGKDVGAISQLGCPATAVVPRVSVSGKPPMDHIRDSWCQNLQLLLRSSLTLFRGHQQIRILIVSVRTTDVCCTSVLDEAPHTATPAPVVCCVHSTSPNYNLIELILGPWPQ